MTEPTMRIHELRLVLTVDDFDHATAFFRDALGLTQVAAWENDGGHAVLHDAGRATLVLPRHALQDLVAHGPASDVYT